MIREFAGRAERIATADLVEELQQRIGYVEHVGAQVKEPVLRERRLENLRELSDWLRAMQKEGAAGDLAAQLSLLSFGDRDDPGNAVRLMTLHSAKGTFRYCAPRRATRSSARSPRAPRRRSGASPA